VNLRGEIVGLKAYTSVKDISGPVDYAFLQVPAYATTQVIKDCAAKGVKLSALFSAGFSEGDKERGAELEQELVSVARQGAVRLIGPNCMGFYCPSARVTFCASSPQESGPVGVLCQSGGNSI
jgi:acyl-CoA synthetase (NDP forming)